MKLTRVLLAVGALGGGVAMGSTAVASAATAAPVRPPTGGTFVPAPLPSSPGPFRSLLAPSSNSTIKIKGSSNWSGYVQSAKTGIFTSVTDTWRVPTVSALPPGLQVSSDWVGIGGFKDGSLVQAGTQGFDENGVAVYSAWTEILPASEVGLSMTVGPGDSITTVVRETAPNTWLMQVTDNSTSVTRSRTVSYASSGLSAEMIHERTTICTPACSLGTLATTTNVTFDPGSYTSVLQPTAQPLLVPAIQSERVTPHGVKTKADKVYEVEMVNSKSVIATPSAPDSDSDGATIAYGGVAPPAPSS